MKVREFIEKCVAEGRTGQNEDDCYFAAKLGDEEHILCLHSFLTFSKFALSEDGLKWMDAEVTRERFEPRIFGASIAIQCEGRRALEIRISEVGHLPGTRGGGFAQVTIYENASVVWSSSFAVEEGKQAGVEQSLGAAVLYALKRPELPK